MNPFDWTGPHFLAFYAVFALVLVFAVELVRRVLESSRAAGPLTNPYEIAYLRGGKDETIRLATLSLIDRRVLQVCRERDQVAVNTEQAPPPLESALESAVREFFSARGPASSALRSRSVIGAAEFYRRLLESKELLPGSAIRWQRAAIAACGLFTLWLVAGYKIWLAFARGHRNVEFLIALATIASFGAAYTAMAPHRTAAGDRHLRRLASLFGDLNDSTFRMAPHQNTSEMMIVMAVFGMSALPEWAYPYPDLYPKAHPGANRSSDGGSGCGSGCGGDGGGCGGGCGGGGCGGCGS